ncbi:glycosyltransferase family 4 protein [Bacillus sp. V3]|nr:glycosyltransferase family 4 protein [Bacillus sp. V3]
MIYYFTDIVLDEEIMRSREFKNSEAGKLRSLYVANSIDHTIKIVSMGTPEKKGIFKDSEQIVNEKIDIYYLKGFQFNQILNIFIYFFYLILYLRKLKKNDKVIIYNFIPKQTLPILFMKKIVGFTLIAQVEELYSSKNYSCLKNKLNQVVEWLAFKICDGFILVNSLIKDKRIEEKPSIISQGYAFSKKNKPIKITNNESLILYSGRLDYEGGVDIFLDSLKYLEKEVKVIITGKGTFESHIHNLTVPQNVKVEYKGFVDEDVYEEILTSSTLCINPIRLNSEFSKMSFPSKVLQYLSFGNKVVSSNFGGLNDLPPFLRDSIITYANDDPKELAKAIERALESEIQKEQVAENTWSYFTKQSKKIKSFVIG